MRLLALIGWLIILFLFTFVDDLRLLIYHHQITFNLTRHPDFSDFASLYSVGFSDRFLMVQKLGHFIGFLFLPYFLLSYFRSIHITLLYSVLIAISTELMQPFFHRSGRMIDIFINGVGILTFLFFYLIFYLIRNLSSTPSVNESK